MTFNLNNINNFENIQSKIQKGDETASKIQKSTYEIKFNQKQYESLKEYFEPIKEETVKNKDGTTSTVKTYKDGRTTVTTNKKDNEGKEYTETIQKRADGSLRAETKLYPGKSEETKFYNESGDIDTVLNKTFAEDGKTVKTENLISYSGKDSNGNPKVSFESHTYENGDKSEIFYDENGKPKSATVSTKDGKNAAELQFDLKDSVLEAGDVKLDEKGWPITKDGKFPKLTSKVTNKGLPDSRTYEYRYNSDGSITEVSYYTEGSSTSMITGYKNIEALRNGISALEEAIKNFNPGLLPAEDKTTQKTEEPDKSDKKPDGATSPDAKVKKGNNGNISAKKSNRIRKEDCRKTDLDGVYYNEKTKTHYIEKNGKMVEYRVNNEKVIQVNKDGSVLTRKNGENGNYKITKHYKNGTSIKTRYGKDKKPILTTHYNKNGEIIKTRWHNVATTVSLVKRFPDGSYIKYDHKSKLYARVFKDGNEYICDKNGNKIQS